MKTRESHREQRRMFHDLIVCPATPAFWLKEEDRRFKEGVDHFRKWFIQISIGRDIKTFLRLPSGPLAGGEQGK